MGRPCKHPTPSILFSVGNLLLVSVEAEPPRCHASVLTRRRANRPAPELETLIGYFLNPVALRTQLSGSLTFREVVKRVRQTVVNAQANAEASLLVVHYMLHYLCASTYSKLRCLLIPDPAADRFGGGQIRARARPLAALPVLVRHPAGELGGRRLHARGLGDPRLRRGAPPSCRCRATDHMHCTARECCEIAVCHVCKDAGGQASRPVLTPSVPQADKEMAKMDLELWMQEDGTGIFGAVLYSEDIFDEATAQGVAAHVLVGLRIGFARRFCYNLD